MSNPTQPIGFDGAILSFLDIETTGLDPHRAEIWEVGLVNRYYAGEPARYQEQEHHWFLKVDHLETAEQVALDIGGYHVRHPEGDVMWEAKVRVTQPFDFARDFERLTRGATLVGANVRFDERFLNDYLRAHHRLPGWFFRMIDVEALVQGYKGLRKPTGLAKCANLMEIVNNYEAHTALDDAKLARDVYDSVIAGKR